MIRLRDPKRCPECRNEGRVINSNRYPWYRKRRYCCPRCNYRWTTYETVLNPRHIRIVDKKTA